MLTIENTQVVGWEPAIRGMRNPMNSWEKSDSSFEDVFDDRENFRTLYSPGVEIGSADHDLMMRLAAGGPVHAKYRRMITVYADITAPLYWWKEFDTYKVGTVANSCSTMHKIQAKEFDINDFSHEHVEDLNDMDYNLGYDIWLHIVERLNYFRNKYLETKDKKYWWQMIQLLPSSYNQKRTVMMNYEVLHNIYVSRKDHKLDEWRVDFIDWIKSLPYSELITCDMQKSNDRIAKELLAKQTGSSPDESWGILTRRFLFGKMNDSVLTKDEEKEAVTWQRVFEDFRDMFPVYAKHVTDYRPTDKPFVIKIWLDITSAVTGSDTIAYDYTTKKISSN